MSRDQQQLFNDLMVASKTVAEYAGADSSIATLRLLRALADSYLLELASVAPERLQFYQAAYRQVTDLIRVFEGNSSYIPKIS